MRLQSVTAMLFTGCLVLASCDASLETPIPANKADNRVIQTTEPGLYSVEFSESLTKRIERGESLSIPGLKSIERMFPDAGEWEERHRAAGLHHWYRLNIDTGIPETKAVNDLSDIPGVLQVSPVRKKQSTAYFNDPYADRQWALYNDGSLGTKYTEGCDVNVVPVWERFCTGSQNVIVAVLDQGVQLNHPDLEAACIQAGVNGSKSFIDNNPYSIQAGSHGSHCAGVIAAVNGNNTGICGIAGGQDGKPGVRILSCEILRQVPNPDDPSNPLTQGGNDAAAFVWAADHGAVITSNSWGYVYDSEQNAEKGGVEPGTKTAIDYFIRYAGCDQEGKQRSDSPMKGGVVIFAAGNEAWRHGWPAEYEKVIAVGAVSAQKTKAYYSNYGDWVDICAPGGDAQQGPMILSCIDGSSYAEMQGTSMACPHVSGVAALIVSYFGGPGFTNEMLVERLYKGASTTNGPGYSNIGPMVDALGSFSLGGTKAPEAAKSIESKEIKSNTVTLSWKVTADPDDVKTYSYIIVYSKNKADLSGIDVSSIPSGLSRKVFKVERRNIGDAMEATIGGLEFDTKYYFAAIASDYVGNHSELSDILEVSTGKNNAPEISSDLGGEIRIKSHETLSFSFNVTEPDGHGFTVDFEPGSDAVTYEKIADGAVYGKVSIKALDAEPGTYSGKIKATDVYGASSEFVFNYEILPNHAPSLLKEIDNVMLSGPGQGTSMDFTNYFTDEDGEALGFDVAYSTANIVHLAPNGSEYTITALTYGLTEVTVTASDARGEKCSATFKILVPDSSQPVVLYPNPFKTSFSIRPLEGGSFSVSVSNKAGACVYTGNGEIDPFNPMVVDMKDKAAGTYYVKLKGAGIDETYTVVKL